MNASMVTTLAGHIATVVEDGIPVINVEMGEMADGSRRSYALVTIPDDTNPSPTGEHLRYRITSPAPEHAPKWARDLQDAFTVEIETDDFWETIETFSVEGVNAVSLSWIGSSELEARVVNYSASEIQAELERVLKQRKLDDERRHAGTYRGRVGSLISTPEFWDRREAVLRKALTTT